MDNEEIDFILEKWDQTEKNMQRNIVIGLLQKLKQTTDAFQNCLDCDGLFGKDGQILTVQEYIERYEEDK